jgi:hypothetical protein
MSLNIGTDAVEAARQLHQSDAKALFETVRRGIYDQARDKMNHALECEHHTRADAIGYARAMRDIYLALEGAATGVRPTHVEKPSSLEGSRATR